MTNTTHIPETSGLYLPNSGTCIYLIADLKNP
jgi:hypothetical protein